MSCHYKPLKQVHEDELPRVACRIVANDKTSIVWYKTGNSCSSLEEVDVRFALGCTRFVILTRRFAIKIARPRLIRPLLQLWRHTVSGEVRTKLQRFDHNPMLGGLKYVTAGIQANLAEWKIYTDHASDILAPTLWTFYGIVNVQVRGEAVAQHEIESHYLYGALHALPIENNDVLHAKQFCRIKGKVVLADYGRSDLVSVLRAYQVCKSPA